MKKGIIGLAIFAIAGTSIGLPQIIHGESMQATMSDAQIKQIYEEAKAERIAAEQAKANADAALTTAKSALDTAKTNLEAAQKAQIEADQKANPDLVTAQKRYDDAQAQYQKGSAGYFKMLADAGDADAKKAHEIIIAKDNSKQDGANRHVDYSGYTTLGDANDASNLENMKQAVDMLQKVNDYRQRENTEEGTSLGDLKVTSSLIAIAQYQLNYSKGYIGHSAAFNVGENLSWGYDNPFYGWYDEEKKEYLSGNHNHDDIGHYLNIVDADYVAMGYAYVPKSNEITKVIYNDVYGQTFASGGTPYAANAVNVSDYQITFTDYYDNVKLELTDAKQALDEAKDHAATTPSKTPEQLSAEANVKAAQKVYDEAQAVFEQAKNDVDTATKYLAEAMAKEDSAKQAYDQIIEKTDSDLTAPIDSEVNTSIEKDPYAMESVNTGVELYWMNEMIAMVASGGIIVGISKKRKRITK